MISEKLIQRFGGWQGFRRAVWALAIKALPAIYGIGLILAVIRVIPVADYGRYGIAFAYINFAAICSRGLWGLPLIRRTAVGQRDEVLGPAIWLSLATAIVGAMVALILLPALHVGFTAAAIAAAILLVLVPRDIALSLAQGHSKLFAAFLIDLGYFLGSLVGFTIAASFGLFNSAEDVLIVNLISASVSALTGILFFPFILRPSFHGNWSEVFGLGKWMGGMAIGELYLQQGDLLILGALVTPVQLAPYIAAKTLFRVYALLSQAVNFLVIASAPRHGMEGTMDKLRRKLKGILVLMWLILIPVNAFLFFTADSLLPGILGNEYTTVVPFFLILMVATFFEPFYSVTATALLGLGRPKNVAALFWGLIVCNILANVILVYELGLTPAPWILVGTYVCLGLGMLYSGWKQLE